MLGLAFIYRSIFTVLGGYITARFAPQNKINHVKALMILEGEGAEERFEKSNKGWDKVLKGLKGLKELVEKDN